MYKAKIVYSLVGCDTLAANRYIHDLKIREGKLARTASEYILTGIFESREKVESVRSGIKEFCTGDVVIKRCRRMLRK